VRYGVGNQGNVSTSIGNYDWNWFSQHTSYKN